jgi:hypothetical protein
MVFEYQWRQEWKSIPQALFSTRPFSLASSSPHSFPFIETRAFLMLRRIRFASSEKKPYQRRNPFVIQFEQMLLQNIIRISKRVGTKCFGSATYPPPIARLVGKASRDQHGFVETGVQSAKEEKLQT